MISIILLKLNGNIPETTIIIKQKIQTLIFTFKQPKILSEIYQGSFIRWSCDVEVTELYWVWNLRIRWFINVY